MSQIQFFGDAEIVLNLKQDFIAMQHARRVDTIDKTFVLPRDLDLLYAYLCRHMEFAPLKEVKTIELRLSEENFKFPINVQRMPCEKNLNLLDTSIIFIKGRFSPFVAHYTSAEGIPQNFESEVPLAYVMQCMGYSNEQVERLPDWPRLGHWKQVMQARAPAQQWGFHWIKERSVGSEILKDITASAYSFYTDLQQRQ